MKKPFHILLLFLIGCQTERPTGWIDEARVLNRDAKDWVTLGGDYMMQHYSPLNLINKENVRRPGLCMGI
ncbi:MAG: hypothetical protein U5K54_14715 [Cytophagales bacterium]|nr:hypothetical protein [Cytophagales bacterium]